MTGYIYMTLIAFGALLVSQVAIEDDLSMGLALYLPFQLPRLALECIACSLRSSNCKVIEKVSKVSSDAVC